MLVEVKVKDIFGVEHIYVVNEDDGHYVEFRLHNGQYYDDGREITIADYLAVCGDIQRGRVDYSAMFPCVFVMKVTSVTIFGRGDN